MAHNDTWTKRVWTVLKKEVVDHLRDRRALLLALIYPLLGPALVAGGLYSGGKILPYGPRARPLGVPVIGAEYAPELITYIQNFNIQILPAVKDPERALRQGMAKVVLVIAPEA